jgi:alpha-1,2-mannosyltransferase
MAMTFGSRVDSGRVIVVLGAIVAWAAAVAVAFLTDRHFEDIDVYRAGGRAWIDGISLYGPEFGATVAPNPLGFTYPPLSAVLFAGLSEVPRWLAIGTFSLLGLLALGTTVHLAASRLVPSRFTVGTLFLIGTVLGTVSEPIRDTLTFGQINLILMGLVALDCLLPRTPWPRGLLLGAAAAVKLTPAFFVLFFLARRQWRPALVAGSTAVGLSGAGFLLAPRDSVTYWTSALLDTGRIGTPDMASNQSLSGVLHRVGFTGMTASLLWLTLGAIVIAVAWLVVSRLRRAGEDVAALVVLAAAGLLVSPISWSHHWVWIAPALVYLVHRGWSGTNAGWRFGAVFAAAVFVVGPHWFLPRREGREMHWTVLEQVVGNAYIWFAAIFLAAMAWQVSGRLTQRVDAVT